MVVAFDVLAVVRAFVKTDRTLDNVGGPDSRFAAREVGEENLFGLTLLAGETEIPLSRRKSAHPDLNLSSEILKDDEDGANQRPLYKRQPDFRQDFRCQ